MINLQYPTSNTEMFPLILEDGTVVGSATRRYCHSGSKALHPVVHLHIFDSRGRLYLQRRSMTKDIAPGLWDTSVGGHVDYGEDLLTAVCREAREEVGLEVQPDVLRPLFQYIWESERERELVTAFGLIWDGELHPDHQEVDEGRFFELEDLRSFVGKGFLTQQFEQQELQHLMRTKM